MTIPSPVNLGRFQTGLVQVLADATGLQVAWSYGGGVYSSTFGRQFVSLTMRGPVPQATTAARGFRINPCASVAFTVTAATEGQLIGVYVNDIPIRHEVTDTDTITSVRNTLVAAVAEVAPSEFTATAGGGAGEWTLTPAYFGGVWAASKFGSMDSDVTLEDELALVTAGTQRYSIQVEAFSKGTDPSTGAWAMVNQLMAALQLPDNAVTLKDYGVGIGQIGQGVDLSAIAGGSWETRVAFDVDVNLRSVVVSPVGQITSASISSAFSQPLLTSTIDVSP